MPESPSSFQTLSTPQAASNNTASSDPNLLQYASRTPWLLKLAVGLVTTWLIVSDIFKRSHTIFKRGYEGSSMSEPVAKELVLALARDPDTEWASTSRAQTDIGHLPPVASGFVYSLHTAVLVDNRVVSNVWSEAPAFGITDEKATWLEVVFTARVEMFRDSGSLPFFVTEDLHDVEVTSSVLTVPGSVKYAAGTIYTVYRTIAFFVGTSITAHQGGFGAWVLAVIGAGTASTAVAWFLTLEVVRVLALFAQANAFGTAHRARRFYRMNRVRDWCGRIFVVLGLPIFGLTMYPYLYLISAPIYAVYFYFYAKKTAPRLVAPLLTLIVGLASWLCAFASSATVLLYYYKSQYGYTDYLVMLWNHGSFAEVAQQVSRVALYELWC